MKLHDATQKTLCKIEKKEQKYLQKTAVGGGLAEKISIPDKAQKALTIAFSKGLALVLDKGDTLIRRGIAEEEIRRQFERQNDNRHPKMRAQQIRTVGAQARLLGIGLPDIPLFLGVLLRGIYQIALSYGVDVRTEDERVYLLLLLACAAAPDKMRQARLDVLAKEIQKGKTISEKRQLVQQEAAESLAQGMLTAKFIQGLPIVGIIGGVYNLPLYRRITGYAELEYQKRYLWKRCVKE